MRCPRVRRILAGVLAAIVVVAPGAAARAEPAPAEVEAEITRLWNEAEPLIEKYNEVHEQYQKNKAKQAELQRKIEPLQRQIDLALQRVGALAADLYKGRQAATFDAVIASGSPENLVERLEFAEIFAYTQRSQILGVEELKAQYDAVKVPLDALVDELKRQDADLARRRKEIETKLNELQKLRIRAYGASGMLGSFRPWPCPSEYLPTPGHKAALFACKQAGKPYVWAASGPNAYDCSGLTLRAWAQVGVYLPHNAAAQRRSMPYVSRANLRIGDLVFYYSDLHHVGIYVGNGKIVAATTFGDYVRMQPMDLMPIHSFGRPG